MNGGRTCKTYFWVEYDQEQLIKGSGIDRSQENYVMEQMYPFTYTAYLELQMLQNRKAILRKASLSRAHKIRLLSVTIYV